MNTARLSIYLLICIIAFCHVSRVNAHAVITSSSLTETPVKPGKDTIVTVRYNSRIELALSQIFLVRKGDRQTRLNFNPYKQPGQIQIQLPALQTGEYALRFKIFATDGHLTEDIINFWVK